jgi:hypothetical protein
MRHSQFKFIGLFFLLSIVFTIFKVPVASSQGQVLSSAFVSGELPITDPAAEAWQRSRALQIQLSAQQVSRPMALETNIRSVTAKAIHSETHLAIMVEWQDETQNDTNTRVQDFQDMVALQFPLSEGQPFFCMGQEGGNVELWLWKAGWQADLNSYRDMELFYPDMYVDEMDPVGDPVAGNEGSMYYPALQAGNLVANHSRLTSVEALVAGGYGSLTSLPEDFQNVHGYGEWSNGKWQVIFSRDLIPSDSELASFQPGKTYPVAFAAWDGAYYERNGQKSTSQWVSLKLEKVAPESQVQAVETPPIPFWKDPASLSKLLVGAVVFFLLLGVVIYFRLPEES